MPVSELAGGTAAQQGGEVLVLYVTVVLPVAVAVVWREKAKLCWLLGCRSPLVAMK